MNVAFSRYVNIAGVTFNWNSIDTQLEILRIDKNALFLRRFRDSKDNICTYVPDEAINRCTLLDGDGLVGNCGGLTPDGASSNA